MCGRYTLTHNTSELSEYRELLADLDFGPSYNIAPTQLAPVIVADGPAPQARLLRWGLIPFWAKDESVGFKTINARSETAAERASFKNALKKRRCLVLADGFYEWQKVPGGKQPYYIYRRDRKPFCFAGLWESWDKGGTAEPLHTYTILTTTPNLRLAEVHDRMPVILPRAAELAWLNAGTPLDSLPQFYAPFPAEELALHPIGAAVGNVRNNYPALIDQVQ